MGRFVMVLACVSIDFVFSSLVAGQRFHLVHPHDHPIVIEALVAGAPRRLVVDSAGQANLFDPRVKEAFHAYAFEAGVRGIGGGVEVARVYYSPVIQIGDRNDGPRVAGGYAVKYSTRALVERYGIDIDGSVGLPLFASKIVQVNINDRELTLIENGEGKKVWGSPLPLKVDSSGGHINLMVGSLNRDFLINTGLQMAMCVDERTFERLLDSGELEPFGYRYMWDPVGGKSKQRAGLVTVTMGPFELDSIEIVIGRPAVGIGLLRSFVATLDYSGSRVYLRPSGMYRDRFRSGLDGLSLAGLDQLGRGAIVRAVADGSPAATAGIRAGMEILRVDGVDVTHASVARVRDLMNRPQVHVVLRDKSQSLPATLQPNEKWLRAQW